MKGHDAMGSRTTLGVINDQTDEIPSGDGVEWCVQEGFDPSQINQIAFVYYTRLARVKEYVLERYRTPITLREVADVAGLEEKYFSSFFHAKVGVCFRQWLAYIRINRAIDILKHHDQTILRTALDVGFRDVRTFQRTFKKCTGMTPQSFKYQVRPS